MALRDVNLIAVDILERRYTLRHLVLWCGSLIAVAALTLGLYAYQTRIHDAAKRELLNAADPGVILTAMTSEMKKGQQELAVALKQRDQLVAMSALQRSYALVMAKLAQIMNDQTWLQQLVLETGRDRVTRLKLAGSSLSHDFLGDFMQRLSSDPLFGSVVLKSAQESEIRLSGGSSVQFQIDCDIAGR